MQNSAPGMDELPATVPAVEWLAWEQLCWKTPRGPGGR